MTVAGLLVSPTRPKQDHMSTILRNLVTENAPKRAIYYVPREPDVAVWSELGGRRTV